MNSYIVIVADISDDENPPKLQNFETNSDDDARLIFEGIRSQHKNNEAVMSSKFMACYSGKIDALKPTTENNQT